MILRLTRIIGDRHAGFILCLLVIANLIWGSAVMEMNKDLYPAFSHLDLRRFFEPVMPVHAWLYALLVTFALFGLNLAACLVNSVVRLLGNPAGRLKASAALLFHVALVFTMLAHLYEGFSASTGQVMISEQPVELPGIGTVKLESMNIIHHPDFTQKDAEAGLLIDRPDGTQARKVIAFNEPALLDGGQREIVMLTTQKRPAGVTIRDAQDGAEHSFMPNQPQVIANGMLVLQGLMQDRSGTPYAQFLWRAENGRQQRLFMALDSTLSQQTQISLEGATYRFQKLLETPFIIAIVRHNPAIPLILISLLLAFSAVLVLLIWLHQRMQRISPPS